MYDYLRKQAMNPLLTQSDAAMLLIAHHHIPFDDFELQTILNHLQGQSSDWIKDQPLFITTLRLLALATYDQTQLDGTKMALYITRLIALEKSPGGPYTVDASESEIVTNAAIAQLFHVLTIPLPKLDAYLEKMTNTIQNTVIQNPYAWLLFWPYQLTTAPLNHSLLTMNASLVTRTVLILPTLQQQALRSNPRISTTALEVREELALLDPLIRTSAYRVWQSVVGADVHFEIALLSTYFLESIIAPPLLGRTTIAKLNKANFYVWMAYSQYDDYIDNEGTPLRLPVANITHRRAYALFHQVASNAVYSSRLISECFDAMDIANTWELTHCRHNVTPDTITINRLPKYGNKNILAQRAGAHTLGPLLILSRRTLVTAAQRRALSRYLKHYLIARQLNDDLHDWKEDLRQGHSSFVVTFLLRKTKTHPGSYAFSKLTETLQTYFWKSGLEKLHELILRHTQLALAAATTSGLFQTSDNSFLSATVYPIIESVHKSSQIIKDKKVFLETYTHSP